MNKEKITKALDIYNELKEGNKKYQNANKSMLDVNIDLRSKLFIEGQSPKVCILTCSDSRVMAESIFNLNLGDAFVIRCAGGMADDYTLASIDYAYNHLHVKAYIILAHSSCGAISSSLKGIFDGSKTDYIVRMIKDVIGSCDSEKDAIDKCLKYNYNKVKGVTSDDCLIVKALYKTDSGEVLFYED